MQEKTLQVIIHLKRGCQMEHDKVERRFKVGDVVMLNSGGPGMTISTVDYPGGWCYCKWFSVGGHVQADYFQPEMLMAKGGE